MTWLFPLYLLGAGAVIAPILMHLRRKPPEDRVEFSSLMFLDAQTPVPVSRRRVENWLLLLLRCLALIVLALMFSRPLWRTEDKTPASSRAATVVLLDRSASMRRGELWKLARDEAEKRLVQTLATDLFALVVFDSEPQVLWSLDQDKSAAGARAAFLKQRLGEIKPSWQATDLGGALVEGLDLFSRAQGLSGMKKKLVLISDLQEGAKLEALRTQVWPENIVLEVHRVDAPTLDNLTPSLAAASDSPPTLHMGIPMTRVRISNARESTVSDYRLDTDPPIAGYLPPGASRVITLGGADQAPSINAPAANGAPDRAVPAAISLSGDAWDFDNRLFIAPPQPKPVKIAFIGDEKTRSEAASPLFYLSRALQPTASLAPELQVLPETTADIPKGTQLVFLSGSRTKPDLRRYLRAGGFVVCVITDETTAKDLEVLTGITEAEWGLSSNRSKDVEDYAMLAEVKTEHPLLRPFADERLRDFTKLRFWQHRRVTFPQSAALSVLARFDNGDPAILTLAEGAGTLVLLTSGWHPADSQLALSTKFVPLLYGWLEAAGFRNERVASLLVGDVLPTESMTSITLPDGQKRQVKPGEVIRAEVPGIYLLQDSQQEAERYAVNLAPEEGRISPLDLNKLRELGVRLDAASSSADGMVVKAEEKERLALSEQEARQNAWLWLLGGLLVLLGGETWLAGRIRQSMPQRA